MVTTEHAPVDGQIRASCDISATMLRSGLALLLLLSASGTLANATCSPDCPDRDSDGVVDTIDQCPESEPGAPVTIFGCAHDTDHDGMPDYRDHCPHSSGDSIDAWGCPARMEIPLEGVSFEVDSAKLQKTSRASLDNAVAKLRAYAYFQAEVVGHTDNVGSAAHNRRLSRLRAEAVRDYLVQAGIDSSRIIARGYGEARPLADNETEAGRSRNRRVVLRILSGELVEP